MYGQASRESRFPCQEPSHCFAVLSPRPKGDGGVVGVVAYWGFRVLRSFPRGLGATVVVTLVKSFVFSVLRLELGGTEANCLESGFPSLRRSWRIFAGTVDASEKPAGVEDKSFAFFRRLGVLGKTSVPRSLDEKALEL